MVEQESRVESISNRRQRQQQRNNDRRRGEAMTDNGTIRRCQICTRGARCFLDARQKNQTPQQQHKTSTLQPDLQQGKDD